MSDKRSALDILKEADINLDIDKGDTLLSGRFKNSPMIVKETGIDEKGQHTVNKHPLLSYRIKKQMPAKKPKPAKKKSALELLIKYAGEEKPLTTLAAHAAAAYAPHALEDISEEMSAVPEASAVNRGIELIDQDFAVENTEVPAEYTEDTGQEYSDKRELSLMDLGNGGRYVIDVVTGEVILVDRKGKRSIVARDMTSFMKMLKTAKEQWAQG